MSCPVATSCQGDRYGRATCVPEFTGCGHPPDVPGASVTYDGRYQGAVATYACEKDYTVCHQINTSVCQASGEWGNVTGLCRKFRWRNPRVNSQYDLPCGPENKFNVLVLVTPTTTTRCLMDLWAGEDVTFHSDFRFNYVYLQNVTVINTKLRHLWGVQLLRPLPLTVGKESEIQISLSDGEYKLVVNGITIIRFPEREAGLQPDSLKLHNDCSVRLMEMSV